MTDEQHLDPDLAARLRAAADTRIATRVQAAKKSADQRRQTRAEFGERRKVGLRNRHAIKTARQNLTQLHQQKGTQP